MPVTSAVCSDCATHFHAAGCALAANEDGSPFDIGLGRACETHGGEPTPAATSAFDVTTLLPDEFRAIERACKADRPEPRALGVVLGAENPSWERLANAREALRSHEVRQIAATFMGALISKEGRDAFGDNDLAIERCVMAARALWALTHEE